jgi:hypothetical protein
VRIEIVAAALAPALLIAVHALGVAEATPKDVERRCERLSGEERVLCLREARKARSCDGLPAADKAACIRQGGTVMVRAAR